MIRSTQTTTKFTNKQKLVNLSIFINEYRNVVSKFVDLLWNEDKIPTLLPKETTKQVNTWLSARMLQCAGKQASAIVRGTKKKHKARLYMIGKLNKQGQYKKSRKLLAIHNKRSLSKPDINLVNPELDSRFIHIDMDNHTSFDGYVTISSIGNKMKIQIPFKRNRHFNKLNKRGKIKSGIRLSKENITFMFDLPEVEKQIKGTTLGIDIGKCETISCSNGFQTKPNNHNHDLNSILKIMSKKKKGSRGFKRVEQHRTNYINWSINQLNLTEVKEVKLERIKNMRRGRRSSRLLSHWTYTTIFDKLNSICEEQGVLVSQVTPTYTSQRCSKCGWTRKSNRKGKQFKCGKCGFTHDSDLNAATNISLDLKPIGKKERQLNLNRTGFYWLVGKEPIVPCVKKAK